ncbi:long-chain fatty acid--CoA ligase [Candidatus Bathyarchaeota archaeon]|nr:long-chain fatty acid--CoA ligase [Candidatus Bathyarchaeota archaeon]
MVGKEKKWFKFWPNNIPHNIDYPEISLQEILRKTAKNYPDQIAIIYFKDKITYHELDSLSDHFAAGLIEINIKKGDRVALFLNNIPQFIIAYFGILKIGAVVTTISPLHREREVKYQLINSGAKSIITLNSLYPIIEKIKQKTKLENVILTGSKWQSFDVESNPKTLTDKKNVFSFAKILKENFNSSLPKIEINPKLDLAVLQYTGGTTGTSKGAMLTHMNLVSNTIMFATWIKAKKAYERFLTALPLFHIYGMTTSMNVPISLAARMILIPKFDPTTILETIQKERITIFCGVPTMYSVLLENKQIENYDLTSIRVCISGASPLPPSVQKKFMAITDGFLAEGYGLTEASPVTHCNPIDKIMKNMRIGSIGLPLPNTDAKIFDVTNHKKELPAGAKGELVVKGPQIMLGYWQNSIETALVLKDGWLLTGDIGKMDKDGYFYITDRKKDLIKYKDYSVYPRELEDILYEHPAVKLCAVIGKPTPILGQIPKAFVVLKDNAKITRAELIDFVNPKVAPYKAIRELDFRETLPLSSVGKVLRRVLQNEEKLKHIKA